MCVKPGALVSALANRIEESGYRATEHDLRALLGSGCTKEELRAAFERGMARRPDAPFAEAIRLLESMVWIIVPTR